MDSPIDFVLTNARIVLAERVVDGWVAVAEGRIVGIGEGGAPERGFDMGGDYVAPGLVELHTDHLEAHIQPRPKVRWDILSAILAYDAQMAASGVTTVFDSLRVGAASMEDAISNDAEQIAATIAQAKALDLLRCDHLTHLRCEIATPNVVDDTSKFLGRHKAHLISLMDHTPGQRQFRDMEKMRTYYVRHGFVDDNSFDAFVADRLAMHARLAKGNRRALVAMAHGAGVALASHDDATLEEVGEAIADRVSIAEFPTTLAAAEASHDCGVKVLMGAPNIVRGGSHSGNVAAQDLAEAGRLDILSSDYVPASLILAAFELPRLVPGVDLAHALRLVTKNPAMATGLEDRGEIAIGKRADLIRVRHAAERPVVRCVWRAGVRVC